MSRGTHTDSRTHWFEPLLALLAMASIVVPSPAIGGPTGGDVVAGNVAITGTSAALNITQTGQAAIVNWQDFSIGAAESVTINQAANAALLNRMTGANPSELLGQLNADGRVYLINPNGVLVGSGASINVQEFIASTQDVSDAGFLDFANGNSDNLIFDGDSTAGVTNAGTITATDGDVILVGYKAANSGTIHADNGVAGLAAGKKVWFKPQSAQHIIIESSVSDPGADAADGTGVDNSGNISAIQAELKAAAGNVYALAINQTGMIEATGVANRDGRILLTTDEGTVAHASGTLSAHNADGSGGEVLVGGDYHGLDPGSDDNGIHLAASTTVGAGATIDVSATAANADGGRAVVWSGGRLANTGATTFAGTVDASGGPSGGDGGFVVVAGHDELDYTGAVEVGAAAGDTGTLVLGLPHVNIANTGTNDTANGVLSNTALATQLASANVTIDAFGSWTNDDAGLINLTGDVAWSSSNQLTLKSGDRIQMTADLDAPNAAIELQVMGVTVSHFHDSVYTLYGSGITADRLTVGQNADSEFIGFNPPPEAGRYTGRIDFEGALKVGTLDLKLEHAGVGEPDQPFEGEIADAILAFYSGNEIGAITSSVTGAPINGNISIVDSTGNLTVSGDFSHLLAGAQTSITTAGSLTLQGPAKFGASALTIPGEEGDPDYVLGGEVVLAAKGGTFVNNSTAGAGTISLDADSRFLIYSDNPTDTVKGGLAADPYYGASYANYSPHNLRDWEGSFFFYTYQPTLTFTSNASRKYGANNPTFDYTVTGLVEGDDLARAFTGSPDISTTATSSAGVGDYTIDISEGTVDYGDFGYAFAFAPGTLSINPAPLTITADDKTKTFGGADPTLTATITGLVNGDTADVVSGLVLAADNQPDSDPGDYTITPSGATAPNYDITFVNGTLLISGFPTLLISADDFTIRYGAAIPRLTASISGFASGDDAGIVTGLTLTTAAARGSGVGTYAIVPAGATAPGYDIDFRNGTLTIDPALLTITANSFSRTYGAANPGLGVTYSGFVNGEDASVVTGLHVTTAATAASDAGTYAITPAGASAANYSIAEVPGTLTVNKAPLTIAAADATKVYADNNPAFTASWSGLVLDQTLSDLGALDFSVPATQFTGVGNYAITPMLNGTSGLAGNYTISFVPGTLTIDPRPISIVSEDVSRVYGDANPTLFYQLVGDDPPGPSQLANLIDPSQLVVTTAAVPSSAVGTYAINRSGLSNPNLTITYVPGVLTVNPAPLTVTAAGASRTYGDDNPAFGATTSGLKLTDKLDDVLADFAVTTTASAASNVGTYNLTPGGTAVTANYDITFKPGTLTINKAPLFIVPELSSRLYGDPDPAFTISATGLRNGDTTAVVHSLTFSGSQPAWNVGSHPISIFGATATNYSLTFGTGAINVLPRPLTITADDFTREYGDANPVFTATFDGLASFDTAAAIPNVTLSTPATAASNVLAGGYGITVTSGANANYDITYQQGRLTITPAPISLGVGSFYRTYGHADPDISATLAGNLKLADTIDDLGVALSVPAPTADVGTYPITVTLTNPNYAISASSGGTLQVLPAPIDVSVGNVARRYGDANPAAADVPLTVGGLAFGQQPLDVLSLDFGVDATAHAGNYPINAELISPNYQIASLTLGNLAVLTRQIALKPVNVIRYYGDDNPAYKILVSGDGLASFDTLDDVVFPNLLLVDSILTDGLPSSLTDAGLHQLRVQPAGNHDYEIVSVPGLFVVLPRLVTLTTADATATENRTPPTFATTATNLVPGQTLLSAFPDLDYHVYTQDAPAAVGEPFTRSTFPIPAGYDDAAFRAKYPAPDVATRPQDSMYHTVIVPIQLPNFPEPTVKGGTFGLNPVQLLGLGGTVNPATLGSQPDDDPQPVTNYIQPFGYQANHNYVVTAVHNGTLTILPDPVIVAEKKAAAEAAAGENKLAISKAVFLNPPDGLTAYGLPTAALPALVTAVHSLIANEAFANHGDSELERKIEELLGNEPGSGFDEADLYALLANVATDPELKAVFADALGSYVRDLAGRSPDTYSSADFALAVYVQDRMQKTQDALVAAAKAEQAAWQADQKSSHADMNLVNMYGQDVPYGEFLDSAVQTAMENQLSTHFTGIATGTGQNVSATVAGSAGAGGATFAAVGAAAEALLPYRYRGDILQNRARANLANSSNAAETAGEAGGETAGEVAAETGSELAAETGSEFAAEAGIEVAAEAGGEAVIEAGTLAAEAGVEAGIEAGTAVAEVTADAALATAEATAEGVGFVAGAGAIVATAVVAAVVVSIQRGLQVGSNEEQRQVFEALVGGENQDIHLSGLNLNTETGSPGDKMQATVNQAILNMALADLFGG
ncbi:MAG TPA: MBG domain-containing protein [Opitutus sp.]|nr:MBG domain-containing protein [Opitutus sp.]